jgi:hypothetical protein
LLCSPLRAGSPASGLHGAHSIVELEVFHGTVNNPNNEDH